MLLGCFVLWTALAGGLRFALSAYFGFPALYTFSPQALLFRAPAIPFIGKAAPFVLALSLCLAFYAARRRSRFYGHTAPLLAAVLLSLFHPSSAMPFALLFLAGIAADMLRSQRGRVWRACLWLLVALQCASAAVEARAAHGSVPPGRNAVASDASPAFTLRLTYRSFSSMPDYKVHSVPIDGMHCDACVRRVTAALAKVPGVRVHRVEIGKAEVMAELAVHPQVHAAIENAGYTLPKPNVSS